MKTEAEVVAFLESKVNTRVPTKPSSDLDGQCVTLIKALLEFLGAPNPWKARGNAKDFGDALLREGIGINGRGKVTICISRTMGVVGGVTYGHIWNQIEGGANYEQNGARALLTTKNTRPISYGQQFINMDKWIKKGDDMSIWNNGQTYNLLFHSINPGVAEEAKAANFVGYFGGQDGKESNQALDEIITSLQYGLMVQKAHTGGGNVPSGTYLKINKSDIVEA